MPLDTAPDDGRRARIIAAARKVLDTPDWQTPPPFRLMHVEDIDVANDGAGHILAVMEDANPGARVFMRRSVKKSLSGEPTRTTEWAVVELADGLRIYISAAGVVVTRADINP